MTHDDALLAFERHATSKLRSADDLLSMPRWDFAGKLCARSLRCRDCAGDARRGGSRSRASNSPAASRFNVKLRVAGGNNDQRGRHFYCVPRAEISQVGYYRAGPHRFGWLQLTRWANPAKQLSSSRRTQEIITVRQRKAGRPRVTALWTGKLWKVSKFPRFPRPFAAAITEPELEPREERLR